MAKQLKEIEIPFGAKDSELKGWEYIIPEGMEAEIKDGKIIVKEKESEDERIRKELLSVINDLVLPDEQKSRFVAWLEKQGEQKPAWSEEDEEIKESIITGLEMLKDGASDKSLIALYNIKIDWLKSLKDRYTWRPSGEQMFDLKCAADLNINVLLGQSLLSLYNDLKKLREK